jgi:putative ABC transport system permease protein
MMSREFTKWVLAANLVAWPAAWFFMGRWLEGFAYRAELSPWPFVISSALALGIALVTVVSLSVRAASANPADALRYE